MYAARFQLTNGFHQNIKIIEHKDSHGNLIGTSSTTDNYKNEWNSALNSVQIVFAKDRDVMEALRKLHTIQSEDNIREVLISVGIAAGLLKKKYKDAFLHNPAQLFHNI